MSTSPFHGIFSGSMDRAARALAGEDFDEPQEKPQRQASNEAPAPRAGQVAVDVFEFDNYYIIKAPIAGVKLSDIDIEIADNVLTIRGVRRQTDDLPTDQYYIQECYWGEFSRSVTLPFIIDPKKVKATFNKESILKVLVPKEEKVKIIRVND